MSETLPVNLSDSNILQATHLAKQLEQLENHEQNSPQYHKKLRVDNLEKFFYSQFGTASQHTRIKLRRRIYSNSSTICSG